MALLISFLELYSWVVLASVILSWVPLDPDNPLIDIVKRLTEPVLAPVRALLPPAGGFDFSAFIVLIGLHLLRNLLAGL